MMYAVITGIILGVCYIAAALVLGVAQKDRRQTEDDTRDRRKDHEGRAETDHASDRHLTGRD